MKLKQSTIDKYNWYLSMTLQNEPRPLQPVEYSINGLSAIELFHIQESTGRRTAHKLGTKEPELFERYVQGKIWHGVTVKSVSEDLVNGLVSQEDLNSYPDWVKNEILQQGAKLALKTIGFVPTFVKQGI
jgi:hypothetical protein